MVSFARSLRCLGTELDRSDVARPGGAFTPAARGVYGVLHAPSEQASYKGF